MTYPNLVTEILTNKLYYKDPINIILNLAFFGERLFTMNGKDWTKHRQIMEHDFHHEALKVPFQTINNKDDKQILLSGKSYAHKCKTFKYEDSCISNNMIQCVGKGLFNFSNHSFKVCNGIIF